MPAAPRLPAGDFAKTSYPHPVPSPAIRIRPLRASIALLLAVVSSTVAGNVATDSSFGAASVISKTGNDFLLPSSLGSKHGGNLFHSFNQFDLSAGESAVFSGPGDVTNILARVTGPAASSIDGTIKSTIPGANFYLINPRGILFGPNASIDISGAFTATSSAYVKLTDGGRFDAANPTADVLTSAPVGAFGFLSTPAPIKVTGTSIQQASLTAQAGQSVNLIGGDLTLDRGNIIAPGGKVTMVAARTAGELPADPSRLNRTQARIAGGTVNFTRGGVDTSGPKGGGIVIRGGRLTTFNSKSFSTTTGNAAGAPIDVKVSGLANIANNSVFLTRTTGAGTAGNVTFRAGQLAMSNTGQIGSEATTTTTASARVGSVNVQAASIHMNGDVKISASTFGAGKGGNVNVVARDLNITSTVGNLSGTRNFSGILSNTSATSGGGAGGNVHVTADTIRVTSGGEIRADTSGTGAGGNVYVKASDIFISDPDGKFELFKAVPLKTGFFADTNLSGRGGHGGNIFVEADSLRITHGGLISTKTLGLSAAGNVSLDVGTLEISRGSSSFFTGIAADTPVARGLGGSVRVVADTIHISAGGQISATTSSNGLGGPGGSVFVSADRILLEGRSNAESLSIRLDFNLNSYPTVVGIDRIKQSFQASAISADSGDPGAGGDGGNVAVTANDLRIFDGGQISANTIGQGNAGNVTVNTAVALLRSADSAVPTGILAGTASTETGGGTGGTIQAEFGKLKITNFGAISASTLGTGSGGDVVVHARQLGMDQNGQISADSSGLGLGGDVAVTADSLHLETGGIISASASGPGAGGSVSVTARQITMDTNASIAASSTGAGVAGSVKVTVQEPFLLNSGSNVSTTSDISDSGTVNITSASDIFLNSGSVTVRATQGNAGRIELIAPGMISLGQATVLAEAGLNGGDVFIDPQFVLLEHSRISANAILGAGGNIDIITNAFLASDGAVTASSQASVQGTVNIETVQGDLSGALVSLSSSFVSPRTNLQERCAMRLGGDTSTFLVVGRGGVVPAPEEATAIVPVPWRPYLPAHER